MFREGEARSLPRATAAWSVRGRATSSFGHGFKVYHQGRYIAADIYHSGEREKERGGQREKEKEHSTSTRRVIIRIYVCIYVRMCARRLAASSSFRYPLRPREIIRANDAKRCRSSKRPDGRCIILVSYLASIAGLPQVAITTSAIFFPGELSAIKRSVDLLHAALHRAQRDVLIVRLDRYGLRPCAAGPPSINHSRELISAPRCQYGMAKISPCNDTERNRSGIRDTLWTRFSKLKHRRCT